MVLRKTRSSRSFGPIYRILSARCLSAVGLLAWLGLFFGVVSIARADDDCSRASAFGRGEQAQSDILSGLDVTSAGSSKIVSTKIANVFSPFKAPSGEVFTALGFDVSASAPVDNATFSDYAKQQLLGRKTGILNVYGSIARRAKCSDAEINQFRDAETDRTYLGHAKSDTQATTLPFLSGALGARVIKTELPGQSMAGLGTLYLGVGIDGPLFTDTGQLDAGKLGGVYSLELYASINAVNPAALNKMFDITDAPNHFTTVGVKALMNLPGNFYLNVEYAKAVGHFGRSSIGDQVMLTFGYKRDKTAAGQTAAADSTKKPAN